jgi:hypothetical protein
MLPFDDFRLKTTTSFENIDVNTAENFFRLLQSIYAKNCLQVNNGNGKF